MNKTSRLLILFPLLIFSIIEAQTQTDWQLAQVADLGAIIGSDYSYEKGILSPNGEMIAWIEKTEGICLYIFENDSVDCYPWEWDTGYMRAWRSFNDMYFFWSEDSNKLVITKYPFVQGYDSDLWVFDLQDRAFRNLTNDSAIGIVAVEDTDVHKPPIDYMPSWVSPDELLFFRTYPTQDYSIATNYAGLSLHKATPSTGTVELVLDLSDEYHFNILSAAASPDGKEIAFFARKAIAGETENIHYQSGIWIYDLQTEEFSLMASATDLAIGLPEWFPPVRLQPASNSSLLWLPDGAGLIFAALWDSSRYTGFQSFTHIDLKTNMISPLVDLNQLPPPNEDDEVPGFFHQMPWIGFTSPGGDRFYYFTAGIPGEAWQLYSVGISVQNNTVSRLEEIPISYYPHRAVLYRMKPNGRVLIGGRILLTFSIDES